MRFQHPWLRPGATAASVRSVGTAFCDTRSRRALWASRTGGCDWFRRPAATLAPESFASPSLILASSVAGVLNETLAGCKTFTCTPCVLEADRDVYAARNVLLRTHAVDHRAPRDARVRGGVGRAVEVEVGTRRGPPVGRGQRVRREAGPRSPHAPGAPGHPFVRQSIYSSRAITLTSLVKTQTVPTSNNWSIVFRMRL